MDILGIIQCVTKKIKDALRGERMFAMFNLMQKSVSSGREEVISYYSPFAAESLESAKKEFTGIVRVWLCEDTKGTILYQDFTILSDGRYVDKGNCDYEKIVAAGGVGFGENDMVYPAEKMQWWKGPGYYGNESPILMDGEIIDRYNDENYDYYIDDVDTMDTMDDIDEEEEV